MSPLNEYFKSQSQNIINQFSNPPDNESNTLKTIRSECKYYDETEILKLVQNSKTCSFSALSLNIRSLPCNWLEFKNFLNNTFGEFRPTVICLQEIWNIPQLENFSLEEYHPLFYTMRETGRNCGGGVGLWVDKSTSFEPLKNLSIFTPHIFESQFIKVKTSKSKFTIIGNIYRPPSSDIKRFNQILNDLMIKIKSDFKMAQDVILLGDININLIKHTSHNETQIYLDTLLKNGYMPLISLPTRITDTSATLIDHILTNINEIDSLETAVIVSHVSDHLPIFMLRHSNINKAMNILQKKFVYLIT